MCLADGNCGWWQTHSVVCSEISLNDLFLGVVIGLPSRDSLIDCVDQLYALSMASAAALDATLDGELLMQGRTPRSVEWHCTSPYWIHHHEWSNKHS